METVKLYLDGNEVCAIIGDMPTEKAIGFGVSVGDALRSLADAIENVTLDLEA